MIHASLGTVFNYLVCDPMKLAAMGPWPFAFDWADDMEGCPEKQKRKCHRDEQLAQVGEDFFIFLPPDNSRFVDLVQLLEAGIYQRWRQQEYGLLHSRRVQDRVRAKDSTKVLEPKVNEAPPQRLKGKILTLFFLGGVTLATSFM